MVVDYKFILVTLMFIGFDILTGLAGAAITGTFKSSIMKEGGKTKLFLLIVIAFGIALDYAQHVADLGFNVPATGMICLYISFMEIMSCIENINKAYPNALPKKLVSVLQSSADQTGVDTGAHKE